MRKKRLQRAVGEGARQQRVRIEHAASVSYRMYSQKDCESTCVL